MFFKFLFPLDEIFTTSAILKLAVFNISLNYISKYLDIHFNLIQFIVQLFYFDCFMLYTKYKIIMFNNSS